MSLRLGRETLLHFLSQAGVTIAGFVASFAIARLGGADVLGLYAVAVGIAFWLNIPATAMSNAMTKRISEGVDREAYLGTGLLIEGLLAVGLGLLVVAATPVLENYVTAPLGPLVGFLVASNVAVVAIVASLAGEKQVAASGGLKTIERVLRSTLHIGLIVTGYGVSALLAGHVVAAFVAVGVGFLWLDLRIGRPTIAAARNLLEYARFSWLSKLKTRAFGWMDTIMLAFFAVSSSLIGVYQVSWNIATIFALVATSVQNTLFPEVSEISTGENEEQIHHLLNEGLTFTAVFIIPGLFGALAIGRRVLLIYGPEFTQGVVVLSILVVARLLAAFGNQFLNVVNAVDRPDIAFRVNAVFVAANLLLNVALVAAYGWQGAAVPTAGSGGVVFVLGYWSVSTVIGRPTIPWRSLAAQVGAGLCMTGVVLLCKELLPRSHYITVFIVGLGAAVYAVTLVGFSPRVRTKAIALLPMDIDPQ